MCQGMGCVCTLVRWGDLEDVGGAVEVGLVPCGREREAEAAQQRHLRAGGKYGWRVSQSVWAPMADTREATAVREACVSWRLTTIWRRLPGLTKILRYESNQSNTKRKCLEENPRSSELHVNGWRADEIYTRAL